LIGDWADAADTRHDVGQFGIAAAPEERFEETRRLKDSKRRRCDPAVADFKVEGALALDAGEIIDPDRLVAVVLATMGLALLPKGFGRYVEGAEDAGNVAWRRA